MRILATLTFAAVIFSISPVNAAETEKNANQNTIQKLEIKKVNTLSDNFLVASYTPKVANDKFFKLHRKGSLDVNFVLPRGSFIINASAYTAAADECGKSDGITASGAKVQVNRTLACPPAYRFGTKIKIEGMGTYVCEDRGGAIKGNRFDIYMSTKKEAFAFGRRNLVAMVVE